MWNYRLFKQDNYPVAVEAGELSTCFVGECYYDEHGKPDAHSGMEHNIICGNTPDETKEVFDMIAEAFKAPVVELDAEGKFK